MEKVRFKTKTVTMPADTLTPVGIYLRLRDVFPQSHLLECSDYSNRSDAYSYICVKPIAGIEVVAESFRTFCPDGETSVRPLDGVNVADAIDEFIRHFTVEGDTSKEILPGFFGFTQYDAVSLFDNVGIRPAPSDIPLIRYDFYQVVIALNHFNSTLTISEFTSRGVESIGSKLLSILANRNTPSFPFRRTGSEATNLTDEQFRGMVERGRKHCARGDVFQVVLSRRFSHEFMGDEFNVYRALRSINPSPYLFYFDYMGYKLFGSSPEAQLKVENGIATINPIAGTTARTGDAYADDRAVEVLLANPKENSEHCMLVDLARNDLSRYSRDVKVETYRTVHAYSHLFHLVSTVTGRMEDRHHVYKLFAATFPAGTLSGAPKHRAIQLIGAIEPTPRGYYGGAIGFIGLNGSLNHAIMIRSFLSCEGKLVYQGGAGIVIDSSPQGELEEVSSKVTALRRAIELAESDY